VGEREREREGDRESERKAVLLRSMRIRSIKRSLQCMELLRAVLWTGVVFYETIREYHEETIPSPFLTKPYRIRRASRRQADVAIH
jgi:hypothetical protein